MNTELVMSSKLASTSVSESARQIVADQTRIQQSAASTGTESERTSGRVSAAAKTMASSVSDAARRMVSDYTSTGNSSKDLGKQAAQAGSDVADAASGMSGSVSAMAGSVTGDLDRVKSSNQTMADKAATSSQTVVSATTRMRDEYGRFTTAQKEAAKNNDDLVRSNATAAESNNGIISKLKERVTFTLSLSREQGKQRDTSLLLEEADKRLAAASVQASAGLEAESRSTTDLSKAQDRLNTSRTAAMASGTYVQGLRNEQGALAQTAAVMNSSAASQVASMEVVSREAKNVEGSYALMAAAARDSANSQRRDIEGLSAAHTLEAKLIIAENDRIILSNKEVALSKASADRGVPEGDLRAAFGGGKIGTTAQILSTAYDMSQNPIVQQAIGAKQAYQELSSVEDQYYAKHRAELDGIADETIRARTLEDDLTAAVKKHAEAVDEDRRKQVAWSEATKNAATKEFKAFGVNFTPVVNALNTRSTTDPVTGQTSTTRGILTSDATRAIADAARISQDAHQRVLDAEADENALQAIKNGGAVRVMSDIEKEKNARHSAHLAAVKDIEDEQAAREKSLSKSGSGAGRGLIQATVNPLGGGGKFGLLTGPALPAAAGGLMMAGGAMLPAAAFAGGAALGLGAGAYSMSGAEATNQLQTTGSLNSKQAAALDKQIQQWSVKYGTDDTLAVQSATDLLDSGVPLAQVQAIMQSAMQSAGVTRTPVAAGASAGLSAFANYRPTTTKQTRSMMNAMFAGTAGDFTDVAAAAPTLFQQSAQMQISLPAVMAMVDRMKSTNRSTAQSTAGVAGILSSIQGGMTNSTQLKAAKALGLDPSSIFGEDVSKMGGINAVVQRIDQAAINGPKGPGTIEQIMARTGDSRAQATAQQARLLSTNTDLQALMGGRVQANDLLAIAGKNAQGTTLGQNIAGIGRDQNAIGDAAKLHDKSPMAEFDKGLAGLKSSAKDIGKLFQPVIVQAIKDLDKLVTWADSHKSIFKPIAAELTSLGHDFEHFATWVSTGTRLTALQAFWKEVLSLKDKVGGFLGDMGAEFGKLGKPFQAALTDIKSGFASFGGDAKNGQTAAQTFADVAVGAIRFFAGIWKTEMEIISGAIQIIEKVAGKFKDLTDALGLTSSKAKESKQSTMDLMGELGKGTGIVLALMAGYKLLHAAIDAGRAIYTAYKAIFVATRIETVAADGATKSITIAQWLWNAAVAAGSGVMEALKDATIALLGPWGLIIVALGAIVVALIYAYNHWTGFRNVVNAVVADVLKFVGWLKDGVITGFKQLGSDLSTIIMVPINFLRNAWLDVYNFLIGHSLIPDLINGIVNWFKGLPGSIVSALGDLVTKIGAVFTGVTTWIKDNWFLALVLLFTGLPGLLIAGLIKFGPMIGTFLHDLSPTWLKGAEDWVGQMISAVVKGASKLKDAVLTAVKDAIGAAGNWIKDHNPLGFLGGSGSSGSATTAGSAGGMFTQGQLTAASRYGPESMTGEGYGFKAIAHDDLQFAQGTPISMPNLPKGEYYHLQFVGLDQAGTNTVVAQIINKSGQKVGTFDLMHMSYLDTSIVTGANVKGGQAIGLSGGRPGTYGAGDSTGAHLHFAFDTGADQQFQRVGYNPPTGFAPYSANKFAATGKNMAGNFGPQIAAAALKFGINPAIIASIMQQESSGNPNVPDTNNGRDIGLMQTSPAAAKAGGGQWTHDPAGNIMAGAGYLASLLHGAAHGDMRTAIAMYNGGPLHPQYGYATQVLSRAAGGGGSAGPQPNPWWQANKRYVPATPGSFSDQTGKTTGGTAGHWVDKTAWEKTHYWVPSGTSTSAHEGSVQTVPGHWAATAPPQYDTSIGKFAAVTALAATSPTHPAYDTVAQGKAGWEAMGTTQIPALTTSLKGLTSEVQKPLKVDIAKLAQTWENIGTTANTARAKALDTYQSKVKADNADYQHKLSDVFVGANIKETASQDTYVLARKKILDNEANHAATATEANRHVLADFTLKQNENNTKYLSQEAKYVNEHGNTTKAATTAEANIARTYGVSSSTAAKMLNESLLHRGQDESIYSAKQKQTFDDLAAHLGIHNATEKATLEKHVADLAYNDSKKTKTDWDNYQKQLGKIDEASLKAENSLQASIVAERAKIAHEQSPEVKYAAEGTHLQNVINKQTAIGVADDRYGVTGVSLSTAITKVVAANAKLQARQDAQDKFAYQTATTSAATVPYLTTQVIKMLTNGTTGGKTSATGPYNGIGPQGGSGTVLDQDVAGLAKAFNDAQAAAEIVAKKDYLVAVAAGDAAGQVNYLQGQINKLNQGDLDRLNLGILTGATNLVALTQAVYNDEQATQKRTNSADIARTTVDALNGNFAALGGDLTKMGTILTTQVYTDLMAGHGINTEYLDGMLKLRDAQLTMTQVSSGLDAVLAANEGDLAGMSSAVASLTTVSMARWQQALVQGAGVQNQYTADLVKQANTQKLIQVASLAEDYAIGQLTGDVTKVNNALSGLLSMGMADLQLFIVNIGRADEIIPTTNDSLGSLSAKAISLALNMGTLDDIISGLTSVVDTNRQAAEKEYATTGTISPATLASYKNANNQLTGATWDQVGADLKLYQGTGQITQYYKTLGNEINLQTDRLNNLAVTQGTSSQAYKDQYAILGNLKQQYAGLGYAIDSQTNGTKLTTDQQTLATWALNMFTTGAITPADNALVGMTTIITQSGIDTATAAKNAAQATNDLGTAATSAATSLTSLVAPITALVSKINGINTVTGGPVTVTGSPVTVTGSGGGGSANQNQGGTGALGQGGGVASGLLNSFYGAGGNPNGGTNYGPNPPGGSIIGSGGLSGGGVLSGGSSTLTGLGQAYWFQQGVFDRQNGNPQRTVNGDPNAASAYNDGYNSATFTPPSTVGLPSYTFGTSPVITSIGGGGTQVPGGGVVGAPSTAPVAYVPPDNSGAGGGPTSPLGGASGGGGGAIDQGTPGAGQIIAPSTGSVSNPSTGTTGTTGSLTPLPAGDPRGPAAVLAQANAIVAFTSLMTKNAGPAQLKASAESLQASTNIDDATKLMMQVGVEGGKNQQQMLDAAKVQIQAEMDLIQAQYANGQVMAGGAATIATAAQTFSNAVTMFAGGGSHGGLPTSGPAMTLVSGPGGVTGVSGTTALQLDPRADKQTYNKQLAYYTSQGYGITSAEISAYTDAMMGYFSSPANTGWNQGDPPFDIRAAAESFARQAITGTGTNAITSIRNNGNGYVTSFNIGGQPVIPGLTNSQAADQVTAGLGANATSNLSQMTGYSMEQITAMLAAGTPITAQSNGLAAQNFASWLANGGEAAMTGGAASVTGATGSTGAGTSLVPTGYMQFSYIPPGGTATLNPATGMYTVYDATGAVVPASSMSGYNALGGVAGNLGYLADISAVNTLPALAGPYIGQGLNLNPGYAGSFGPTQQSSGGLPYDPASGLSQQVWNNLYGSNSTYAQSGVAGAGFDTGFGTTGGASGTTSTGGGYATDPMYIKLKAMLDALNAIESNTSQTADNTGSLSDIQGWLKSLSQVERTSADRQISPSTDWGVWFDNIGIASVGMLAGGAT